MKLHTSNPIVSHRLVPALCLIAVIGMMLAAGGCSTSTNAVAERRASGGATPETFRNVSMDACINAAAVVLRDQFGSVRVSANEGKVEGGPESFTQRGGTARVADSALKPAYTMRRFGTIWLAPSDSGVAASCQVRVQRLDTTDYRTFRTHNEFNDLPTGTPIDGDAALTPDQREAWTDLPRDNTMERQLLGAMYRRLNGLSGDVDADSTPQP